MGPDNGGAIDVCPYPIRRDEVDLRTGEVVRAVDKSCNRKECPSCGHRLLRMHQAHFIGALEGALGRLFFLTLTLDGPAYGDVGFTRLTRVWRSFYDRLRYLQGGGARYMATRSRDGGGRWHIHAVVETTVDRARVQGAWVASGGGIDSVADPVGSRRDDLAGRVLYTLRGFRDPQNGRVLTGGGVGFNTAEAVAARAEYARGQYGHEWDPNTILEPELRTAPAAEVDPEPDEAPEPSGIHDVPDPAPRTRAVSLVGGRYGGRYALVSEYDASEGTVRVKPSRCGPSGRWIPLANVPTKTVARRFVRRYDARRRRGCRWAGDAGRPQP